MCSMLAPTGDNGQLYEVSCLGFYEDRPNERKVVGWTTLADGGGLVEMIEAHPCWNSPEVRDREARMEFTGVKCDVCKRERQETNDWLVAITHPVLEGVIFQKADAVQTPRSAEATYQDICGHACAHKRFSAWLDEVNNGHTAAPNTSGPAETEAA